MPQSVDSERAVLSCLLKDAEGTMDLVFSIIKNPEVFYHSQHRRLFQFLRAMREDRMASKIDLVTVTSRLELTGELEDVNGEDYLAYLYDYVPTTANVESYASYVIDAYLLRKLIQSCGDFISRCYEAADDDVSDLIDDIEREVLSITEIRTETGTIVIGDLMREAVNYLEGLSRNKPETMGLQTGFKDLDRLITGLRPGELIVLAARPSVGKTTLALNITRNIAIGAGKAVGFFSLEMGKLQIVVRLLCSEARINLKDVRDGRLSNPEWQEMMAKGDGLRQAPIFIDDTAQLSYVELRQKVRRMKQEHQIELVVVDYLQLMRPSGGNKSTNREQEVAKLSAEIKALSKEQNIPILLLCQLNRQAEQTGGRPKLSHLRESGAIEQDADVVMLLHRERDLEITTETSEAAIDGLETDLIVAKHRNGETGMVKLTFKPETTTFKNFQRYSEDDMPRDYKAANPF